jgi:hypothetical protein
MILPSRRRERYENASINRMERGVLGARGRVPSRRIYRMSGWKDMGYGPMRPAMGTLWVSVPCRFHRWYRHAAERGTESRKFSSESCPVDLSHLGIEEALLRTPHRTWA